MELIPASFETEVEGHLVTAVLTAQDEAFHQCLYDSVRFVRNGDGDAGRSTDGLVLAEQHVEHDAVDAVVSPVDGYSAHDVARLTESIDAAFALLMAGWVPGEVVVD